MTVLLTTLNAKYIHLNLAIRLLYELNQDFDGLEMREFTIKEDRDEVADFCSRFEVVAFSCYIWNISQTLDVARKIKTRSPETRILLGGPEVSYDFQDVICRPEVDFIIVGEGETPFHQFLRSYPFIEQVAGLVRKEGSEIIVTPPPPMFDLENYRGLLPYRTDAPEALFNKVAYLETSRGCPYKCEFCLASLDNKVRFLPNETIKMHLLHLMKHGRVVKFLDRTFNVKRDFTLDIFRFILENRRPDNIFQFEITADILHPDIICFIEDHVPAGLFRFEIGIQTVNQKANLEVSRKQNFEKTKGIIQQLSHKIEMHLDLIVGLALDYLPDIKYSFEEVFKLFAPELQLGFLKFLKGTPVRHKAEQHGFVFDPEPPYQIIESNYLSRAELRLMTQLEGALEIYWNKKRAIRTLKYVTAELGIFDFLAGLGAFFEARRAFHKHNLNDIYEIIVEYADVHFPYDDVLKSLIAVDFYAYHKIKPRAKFFEEMNAADRNRLILKNGLNHQKYRFAVLPLSFDFDIFEAENRIVREPSQIVFQFSGTELPTLVLSEKTESELMVLS